MNEKVAIVGVKREKGWLYFITRDGDVKRVKMARNGRKKSVQPIENVAVVGVKKEHGYLYFLDREGDVSRTRMARGRKPLLFKRTGKVQE